MSTDEAVSNDAIDSDALIVVAALVSRVEALVVASMLESAGVPVHVGAAGHAGVAVNSLALGGHRLWIAARQHAEASAILREVLGDDEWTFSPSLRRAVLRVMLLWGGFSALVGAVGVWAGAIAVTEALLAPLAALTVPVNPQGRGDYYLCGADGKPCLA